MKEQIIKILKKALKKRGIELKEEEIEKLIEVPPWTEMGDYAFPCFFLSERLKEEPEEIALEIREQIDEVPLDFEDIQTSGPYINFFINKKNFARKIVWEAKNKKEGFGMNEIGKKKKTMIEFSQPNTHKAFHVGHIRGTSLGESISRILEFCGEEITRANYQGDTGMHVAKWIWNYTKNHSKTKLKKDEAWISSIYVDAVRRLKKNKKLQAQVDKINKKLATQEDKKLNELWKKTRKISLDAFEKIYKELNVKFDEYYFESEVEKRGVEIIDEVLEKKIAEVSDGAVIINLNNYNLGVWVLARKDGTVLYSTKDLALAEKKFKKKIDNNIYVVGAAQSLHMNQLFKTLELMGFEKVKNCRFVSFSEVRFPHGKMSSRTGENVLYSNFIKEVVDYAKKGIKKKFPKISPKELENRALKISIAAIKYSMLKQNSNKNIIFRKEDVLNFEGESGPYILYSYARASSILRKSKNKPLLKINELEEKEFELVKKISQFKNIVKSSYMSLNPSLIANYSYQLSQKFNEFYHDCPVIGSKQENFRLALVEAFRYTLKNSLKLLGIDVIEKM